MKAHLALALVLLMVVPALGQELTASSGDVRVVVSPDTGATFTSNAGTVRVETIIEDVAFVPAEISKPAADSIKFNSGEKFLLVIPDPQVEQTYVFKDKQLEDTVVLKSPKALSYRLTTEGALSMLPGGGIRIGDGESYLEMLPAYGSDATGQNISFAYEISGDVVRVVIPTNVQYPVTVDPVIVARYSLVLLMHNNIESVDSFSTSVLRDSSTNPKMPVFVGSAGQYDLNTTGPAYGNASAFLRDNGYISVPDSDAYDFGSNNFTICENVLFGTSAKGISLWNQTQSVSIYQRFYIDAGSALYWSANNGAGGTETATFTFTGAYAPIPGKSSQYCVIRNGSVMNLTINGTVVGTGTSTLITKANVAAPVIIGQNFSVGNYVKIDEIQVFNGWAAPISAALMQEWPLYANATPNYGYGDDNSSISLMHYDGSDGGTLFRDEVGNRSWTATGGAVIATNGSKFSPSSLFTGGSGRYISTTNTSAFNYGSGDFTEEIWFNASAYPAAAGYLWSHVNNTVGVANNQSYARLTAAGRIRYGIADNGAAETLTITSDANQPAPLNVWNHLAVVRNGTAVKMYLNGSETASGTYAGTMPLSNYAVTVGGTPLSAAYSINGWLDEFRATSGTARWTGNFTPPTYAYGLTAPAFSMNKSESGTVPVAVQFTDETADSDWTQNGWHWNFGDGSTSTEQNPVHTYTTAGIYNPTLQTLNNNMSSASAAQVFSPGKPVIDVSVSPSSGTAALLTTITVQVSNQTPINSWNWSYGDGYTDTETPTLASGSGSSTVWTKQHVYASFGYFNLTVNCSNSIGVDEDYTYVTASTVQNPKTTYYTAHQVRIIAVDAYGVPLIGTNVTLKYIADSFPVGANSTWLEQAYGIDASVATDMLSSSTAYTAYTGDDGSNTFTLFGGITYGIYITNATVGANCYKRLAPIDSSYRIYCPTTGQTAVNNTLTAVNTSRLTYYRLNSTGGYNLSMIYQDTDGYTTNLRFQVFDYSAGNTLLYDHDLGNPGTGVVVDNYTVYAPRGKEYRWFYNATKV